MRAEGENESAVWTSQVGRDLEYLETGRMMIGVITVMERGVDCVEEGRSEIKGEKKPGSLDGSGGALRHPVRSRGNLRQQDGVRAQSC